MKRHHVLPEMLPGEKNDDWCHRAADSIPADELMRSMVRYLERRHEKNKRAATAVEVIGNATGHGSGISWAILHRFRTPATE